MSNTFDKNLNAVSTRSGWDIVNDLELFPSGVIITDNDGDEKHPEPDDHEINYLIPTEIDIVLPETINVGDAFNPKDIITTTPGYASIPELKWVIVNGEVSAATSLSEVIAAEEPLKDSNDNVIVDEKTGLPVYPDPCVIFLVGTIQFIKAGTVTIAVQSELYPNLFKMITVTIQDENSSEEEDDVTYTWKHIDDDQTVTTTTMEEGTGVKVTMVRENGIIYEDEDNENKLCLCFAGDEGTLFMLELESPTESTYTWRQVDIETKEPLDVIATTTTKTVTVDDEHIIATIVREDGIITLDDGEYEGTLSLGFPGDEANIFLLVTTTTYTWKHIDNDQTVTTTTKEVGTGVKVVIDSETTREDGIIFTYPGTVVSESDVNPEYEGSLGIYFSDNNQNIFILQEQD